MSEMRSPTRKSFPGLPWTIVPVFWVTQFALLTAQQQLMDDPPGLAILVPRMIVTGIAILISLGITQIIRVSLGEPVLVRCLIIAGCAIGGAAIHALVNIFVFDQFDRAANRAGLHVPSVMAALILWLWSYIALIGALLAVISGMALRQRERQISELERTALTAQLQALQYQLNPHFLFNTLNSVAALIGEGRPEPAERMIENLADFLRATLELDPSDEITLDQELRLQEKYIDIERIRFAERLSVSIQADATARAALVPPLITQPLLENVFRHAVAKSSRTVTLTIEAAKSADRLVIAVRNETEGRSQTSAHGPGIGLTNIERRLRTRYGDGASFTAQPNSAGFAVDIVLPYKADENAS